MRDTLVLCVGLMLGGLVTVIIGVLVIGGGINQVTSSANEQERRRVKSG